MFPQSRFYSQVAHSGPYSARLTTVVVKMAVVPGVTASLPTTPRGKKKASYSQRAQLTSYSDLLLLIKLSPIPEPNTESSVGSVNGEQGTVELAERKSKLFGQEKQKVDMTCPSAVREDPDGKASEFEHAHLLVRSFADSLDTWSPSFYVSAPPTSHSPTKGQG